MRLLKDFFLNTLIKCLSYFSPKNPFNTTNKRILIVSTTGLGDTLWGTPAIASIKRSYPEAYIGLLTSPVGFQALKNSPHIDAFFVFQRGRFHKIPQLLRSLRAEKFQVALIFHVSQRLAVPIVKLSGVTEILGTPELTKGFDHYLTKLLGLKNFVHEIERRLVISSALTLRETTPHIEMNPNQKDIEKAKELIKNLASPLIAFHPGSKDPFKRYDLNYFAEVANCLKNKLGATIFITGSKEESSLCQQFQKLVPGSIQLCGTLNILELAALFGELDLLITDDTGPMHIGFAMKTKTIALFGPTNPTLCGPYKAKNAFVFSVDRTCRPCLGKQCRSPFCLLQIPPRDIIKKALDMLKAPKTVETKQSEVWS